MNTIENKAKLWNACANMGLFNNVNPAFEPQIKQLFEENILKFNTNNNADVNLSVLNNFFMEEFKRNLGKLLGTNADTSTILEQKQKEYREMFQPQVPAPIDFGTEKDKPIEGNMEDILREKEEERKKEMSRILGQQPLPLTNVNEPSNFSLSSINSTNKVVPQSMNQSMMMNQNINNPFSIQTMNQTMDSQTNNSQVLKILEKQSIILMKLLESQVKIIELLQKK
jgi:hypothetical protein